MDLLFTEPRLLGWEVSWLTKNFEFLFAIFCKWLMICVTQYVENIHYVILLAIHIGVRKGLGYFMVYMLSYKSVKTQKNANISIKHLIVL